MDVEHQDFSSSYLDAADYDTDSGELTVTFVRNGDSYAYQNVPTNVWQGLKNAISPGHYLRTEITGRF